jgi:hypothetical protein
MMEWLNVFGVDWFVFIGVSSISFVPLLQPENKNPVKLKIKKPERFRMVFNRCLLIIKIQLVNVRFTKDLVIQTCKLKC